MNDITTLLMFAAIAMFPPILTVIYRVLVGPTVPDRVVGIDTVNTMVVSLLVLFGGAFDRGIYVDVAIVYALLSFIGTVYVSKYLEGRL